MGVDKAWYLHFGMGEVYNAFWLALWEYLQWPHFRGVSETILLDEVVCKYCHNKNNLNTM